MAAPIGSELMAREEQLEAGLTPSTLGKQYSSLRGLVPMRLHS